MAQGLDKWVHCDLNHPGRSPGEKLRNRLRLLRPRGHYYTDWIFTKHIAQRFAAFLQEVQPQLIVLEELWLAPYLPVAIAYRRQHPECRIVLDNHNVEGLLAQERSALEAGTAEKGQSWLKQWSDRLDLALRPRRVRRWEQWALRQVDQMWLCSEADRAAMQNLYGLQSCQQPERKLRVVPNGVNVDAYRRPRSQTLQVPQVEPQADSAPVLLFLGSFAYGPNREAAQILIERIYPALRQQGVETKLMLVGHGPTDLMRRAADQEPNIVVTGSVPTVLPYLQQAQVMVVPLHHGSGTRLKLLEAFAAGIPVVSTAKGAEGLAVEDGKHLLLRDCEAAITAGILEILASPCLGQRLATAASDLVQQHYSWDAATRQIQQHLGLQHLHQHLTLRPNTSHPMPPCSAPS